MPGLAPAVPPPAVPEVPFSRHVRGRPGPNVTEKKVLNRAARIGIAGFKALDTISELSEIGGAFWDALPEDVRKKANCADGVSIGQYGLDISPCKARAIIQNLDRLDAFEAFKNVAKNVVEDMTIGQFHKWLAKLYPPGVSIQRTAVTHAASKAAPEAYIAKRLKELWDYLGI